MGHITPRYKKKILRANIGSTMFLRGERFWLTKISCGSLYEQLEIVGEFKKKRMKSALIRIETRIL